MARRFEKIERETADISFRRAFDDLDVAVLKAVDRLERRELEQRWRDIYAPGTGRKYERRQQLGWHVFEEGIAACLQGRSALQEYFGETVDEYWVYAEELEFSDGYLCSSEELPDLRHPELLGHDIFVSPPDFQWTMVFTHEWQLKIGPFFSRKEWLEWAQR